jgi:hypothetical protein
MKGGTYMHAQQSDFVARMWIDFTSCSRIFNFNNIIYGDVTIAGEGLQNL